MLTAVSLYRAQGSAGAWVSSPEGGRHATATSSGQQLPKECRPSSDPARCPCRPLGPPATVTPGRLLVSPVSPRKGRTNWLLSPSATTRRPAPGGGVVVVVVLTVKLMTCLWRYVITDAPNYGGRVPVDTTPGPAPVCRALKTHPISSSTR